MKKAFLRLVLIIFIQPAFAQFAIVNDADGYTNIRKEPGKSEIITQLKTGTIVYGLPETEKKWQMVDYSLDDNAKSGYIYTEKIIYIDDFPSIPLTKNNANIVVLSDGKITVTITKGKFEPKKHTLEFYDKDKWLTKIDGRTFLGTDGGIPEWEYKSVEVLNNGKKIIIPAEDLKAIYQPNLKNTVVNYDQKNETLYIHSANSDGAGAYDVLWIIKKGTYMKRHLMYGF
ncbi:SH3 domain-containing protein [Flavobacterium hauense]